MEHDLIVQDIVFGSSLYRSSLLKTTHIMGGTLEEYLLHEQFRLLLILDHVAKQESVPKLQQPGPNMP